LNVGIYGASGYVGGELLRLLLQHSKVTVSVSTSKTYAGEYIYHAHPNLRGQTNLKFEEPNPSGITDKCDLVFMATPHGASSNITPGFHKAGMKIIDLSADFRLKNPDDYMKWYSWVHRNPELLKEAVYGLPELHREEIKRANLVACPGCMAAAALLALAPFMKSGSIEKDRIVIDTKVGSSGAGTKASISSHHSEHYSVVRPYKPVGHRHTAEIEQELSALAGEKVSVSMSAHAVNMVRGILSTCHVFLKGPIRLIEIWRLYRDFYKGEPFIRFVRDKKGIFRYPDPKVVVGTNYCDIGFEVDEHTNRVVLLSAIDNLVKGAAGTAVQNMNIMMGYDETEGLKSLGLHPV